MKMKTTCAALALTLGLVSASNAAIVFSSGTSAADSMLLGLGGSTWDTIASATSGNANIYWDADIDATFGETGIGENELDAAGTLGFSINVVSGTTYEFAIESFAGADGVATATLFLNGMSTALTEGTQAIFNDGATNWTIDYDLEFEGNADVVSNVSHTPGGGADHKASITFTQVPEPSSTALLGLGGLALILRRRK